MGSERRGQLQRSRGARHKSTVFSGQLLERRDWTRSMPSPSRPIWSTRERGPAITEIDLPHLCDRCHLTVDPAGSGPRASPSISIRRFCRRCRDTSPDPACRWSWLGHSSKTSAATDSAQARPRASCTSYPTVMSPPSITKQLSASLPANRR